MNRQTKTAQGFTIVDMFILLLAAIVAYTGFYWSLSTRAEKSDMVLYDASISATLPYAGLAGLAQTGQKLFNESGNEIGKIVAVREMDLEGGKTGLYLTCVLTGEGLRTGEEIRLSTKTLLADFRIDQIAVQPAAPDAVQS